MLRQFSWGLVFIGGVAVLWLAFSAVISAQDEPVIPPPPPGVSPAPDEPAIPPPPPGVTPSTDQPEIPPPPPGVTPGTTPAPETLPEQAPEPITEQSYVGTKRCVECHRDQTKVWADTAHARAYSNMPAKYQADSSCLKCHVTAFGQPGGYVAGGDKQLDAVGCEACHGPGALHENAALRFRFSTPETEEELEKEMKATIVKMPSDSVCATCHTTQGHHEHPAYEGQKHPEIAAGRPRIPYLAASPVVYGSACGIIPATYIPQGYSIKTCGACHYDQYKQWGNGKHAALSTILPAKYRGDGQCLECHAKGHGTAKIMMTGTGSNGWGKYVDTACESCHGPGREHVRFNMQFVAAPPLGPDLEQASRQLLRAGKPANACIECHASERHKEHVQYDKEKG